jgi:threonine dehydratase
MIELADFEAARERIRGRVRRTPLVRPGPVRQVPGAGDLSLKLESLQVTGSFKARGATNKLLTLAPAEVERGLVTASGGNHGLAVAYVGWLAGARTTIYLPANAPAEKERRRAVRRRLARRPPRRQGAFRSRGARLRPDLRRRHRRHELS